MLVSMFELIGVCYIYGKLVLMYGMMQAI
jgi:hypothetical protein